MDRVWILLVMSMGISLAHMCDAWRARAASRERRHAPAASARAVFQQLRARSLSVLPLEPGPVTSHDLEESPRSNTDPSPAAHAPVQEGDAGEAREKAGRVPRQASRSVAATRARNINKANTPERARSKPAPPKRLVG